MTRAACSQVDLLRERLWSSEEATSRQTEEHQKELVRVREEKDKAKRDLARLKQHLLEKVRMPFDCRVSWVEAFWVRVKALLVLL